MRQTSITTRAITIATLLAAAGTASAGVVSWLNPVDGNWDDGINWSSGSEPGAVDLAEIGLSGVYTVVVRNAEAVEGLTVSNTDATVEIQNARSLSITSMTAPSVVLENDGTIVVNSNNGTSFTRLIVGGAGTPGNITSTMGTGEIVLNVGNINPELSDASLEIYGGGTHATGHTVRGKGRVSGEFFNEGLIVADRANEELRVIGNVTQNPTGVLRATGEGVLGIGENAVISGGTITADTLGTVLFSAGTSTVQGGATLEGPSGVLASSTARIGAGGITNNGTFTVNANTGTSNAVLQVIASTIIEGTGSIDLNVGNFNGDLFDARLETTLGIDATNGPSHAITGKGVLAGIWLNNGTIEADRDGQELRVTAVVTQNPTGSIGASNNGTLGLASNAHVTGGLAVTSSGGLVEATAGTATIDGGFMNLGDMSVRSNAALVIGTGGITNAGTITVNTFSGTSFSNLRVDDSIMIDGTGIIDLNVGNANGDLADATFSTNTGVTATLSAGQTVSGKGVMSGDWISSGTITGNREDQNLLVTGTLVQTGSGTVRADNGGFVALQNLAVSGGSFDSDAASQVLFQLAANTIDGVTSNGNAGIRNGGDASILIGGLTNHGEFIINAQQSTSFTRLSAADGATIDGTGTITLNVSNANGDLADARLEAIGVGAATHAQGHTVRGKGEIIGDWINRGTIAADRAGQDIRVIGTITQSATGTVRGDDGGALVLQTSTLTGGTSDSSNGGSVQFALAGNAMGGVTNSGDMGLRSGAHVELQPDGLTNNGSVTINSTGSTSSTSVIAPTDATIDGTGTILLGVTPANGDIADGNIGALDESVLTLGQGQTLTGKGQISGNVVIEGTIAPGNLSHDSTINTLSPRANGTGGLLTLAPTAEYRVEASAEEVNDRVSSTVPVEVAGTLRFTPIDGFEPPRPTRYTIITAPEITGTFDTLIYEGVVPEGGVFRVVYEDDEVIAAVTCKADIAAPIGVLDLSDITLFTQLFLMQSPLVDLAPPMGVFDLADITTFVSEFLAGCGG